VKLVIFPYKLENERSDRREDAKKFAYAAASFDQVVYVLTLNSGAREFEIRCRQAFFCLLSQSSLRAVPAIEALLGCRMRNSCIGLLPELRQYAAAVCGRTSHDSALLW